MPDIAVAPDDPTKSLEATPEFAAVSYSTNVTLQPALNVLVIELISKYVLVPSKSLIYGLPPFVVTVAVP